MLCLAVEMGLLWGEGVIPLERHERKLQKGELRF